MKRIRLIAVDLDGTLLNDSKEVSERTVAAFEGLPARGVKVVLASARPPRSVRHIYRQLHLDTWQINYNGALIWDELHQRAVFHQPMSGNLVRQIIDFARASAVETGVSCEILDKWYTDREEQPVTTATGKLFDPDVVAHLDQWCDQQVTKLMLLGNPPLVDALERQVSATFGQQVSVLRTDPDLIQIMNNHTSKAVALKFVAEHYRVPLEQVMAIGDNANDISMLKIAGVGVAMDNAPPALKAVTDWVAPSNNDHGVHAALVRYGLCD